MTINPTIISNLIQKLRTNCRPRWPPPIFFKETKNNLKFPLSLRFRGFIDLRVVPNEWRLSIITPIFKKGSPSDPANYWPVALTCVCCKLLESIIVSDIIDYLSSHNLITKHQHGFLKKHSTTTNLLESLNDWTISLSNRKSVLIAYVDFQKAFDSVSHPKLLHKLSGYGIHGNLLFWIGAFLTGRLQQVKVGTKLSGPCPVTSGVPQGSVVGSLLFNLFINDITDHLDPTVTSKMFADDIKMYTELKNPNSTANFQTQLDIICQWSIRWQLPISYAKCNLLYLGRQEANGAILTINPQMPKVKIHLRTPRGGGYHPPRGFWSSRPNFSKIFLMGMFSGSRNPTVIMKKFHLYCMTLKIKVKHLFAWPFISPVANMI